MKWINFSGYSMIYAKICRYRTWRVSGWHEIYWPIGVTSSMRITWHLSHCSSDWVCIMILWISVATLLCSSKMTRARSSSSCNSSAAWRSRREPRAAPGTSGRDEWFAPLNRASNLHRSRAAGNRKRSCTEFKSATSRTKVTSTLTANRISLKTLREKIWTRGIAFRAAQSRCSFGLRLSCTSRLPF